MPNYPFFNPQAPFSYSPPSNPPADPPPGEPNAWQRIQAGYGNSDPNSSFNLFGRQLGNFIAGPSGSPPVPTRKNNEADLRNYLLWRWNASAPQNVGFTPGAGAGGYSNNFPTPTAPIGALPAGYSNGNVQPPIAPATTPAPAGAGATGYGNNFAPATTTPVGHTGYSGILPPPQPRDVGLIYGNGNVRPPTAPVSGNTGNGSPNNPYGTGQGAGTGAGAGGQQGETWIDTKGYKHHKDPYINSAYERLDSQMGQGFTDQFIDRMGIDPIRFYMREFVDDPRAAGWQLPDERGKQGRDFLEGMATYKAETMAKFHPSAVAEWQRLHGANTEIPLEQWERWDKIAMSTGGNPLNGGPGVNPYGVY